MDGEVGDYYCFDGEDKGLVGDDDDTGEGEDIGSDCEG